MHLYRSPFVACLGLGLMAAQPVRASQAPLPRDAFGRPLVSEAGERINYPRPDSSVPRVQDPPARTRPPAERAPASLAVREEWRWSVMGAGIGATGLLLADVDGQPGQEIVAGAGVGFAGNRYFYVLKHRGGSYLQDWVSDELPLGITSLRAAQLDADAPLELLVGSAGQILVYDGATHQLERTIATAAQEIRGLRVADVDSDGQLELVFCDDSALYVYDAASGAQEYTGPGYGGWDVGVGNVDGDPEPEIVVGNGTDMGYVLGGQTHALQWANPWGFGDHVRLGDIDGDGRQEVISGYRWFGVSVFDVEIQSLAATIPASPGLDALQVVDVEGDGPLEIVYGDDQWGGIHVINGQTLVQKWEMPNPEHGVTDVALGDPDADGTRELVWGAGQSSSGADYLFVASSVTQQLEWQSLDVSGPFLALSYGDVDADGGPEIVLGSYSSESGYYGGLWFVYDAVSHDLEYQSPPVSIVNWTGLWRIREANVDADPQLELFVNGSYGYDARLLAFDGLTHAQEWEAAVPNGDTFTSLAVADVDLDGAPEVVGGTDYAPYVYVLDAATGSQEWQSPALALAGYANLSLLRVADVDSDPNPEIVVANYVGQVFVIDGVSHVTNNLGDHAVTALDTPDRDGNGVAEIVVGTDAGDIQVLSTTGAVLETVASLGTRIDGLQVVDVTGDGVSDYVLSSDDQVLIRNGATGLTEWNSGTLRFGYEPVVGSQDSLLVADVDGDGRLEILVNLGDIGFRVYEVPAARDVSVTIEDSADPILVGGNVTYTITASNAAAQPVDAVVVSDVLGPGLAFVASAPGPPTCAPTGQTVSCSLGTLGGGSSAVVAVTAQAASPGSLTSQAFVTGGAPDPVPLNNTATETTTATQTVQADLALGLDDGRLVAPPGQALTYTLAATNLGPWSVNAVNLVDQLPAALQNPVFTPDVGSYDPGSGAWTGLSLAAGTTATMTLSGIVDPAAAGLLTNSGAVAPPAGVDDVVPGNNDAADTDVVGSRLSELIHGSLAGSATWIGHQAFYRIRQDPASSYEVVLDGPSGAATPLELALLESDLTTVTHVGEPAGPGASLSLRWENGSPVTVGNQAVRATSLGCAGGCGPSDAYRLRAYDTTFTISRFNNSGVQLTVVVLQNATAAAARGTLWFWSPAGGLLASQPFASLAPRGSLLLNTSTIPGLAGQSGSITVSHDAGYGGLQGKAVAVEPSTGFTFDSPLTPRPR